MGKELVSNHKVSQQVQYLAEVLSNSNHNLHLSLEEAISSSSNRNLRQTACSVNLLLNPNKQHQVLEIWAGNNLKIRESLEIRSQPQVYFQIFNPNLPQEQAVVHLSFPRQLSQELASSVSHRQLSQEHLHSHHHSDKVLYSHQPRLNRLHQYLGNNSPQVYSLKLLHLLDSKVLLSSRLNNLVLLVNSMVSNKISYRIHIGFPKLILQE